MPKSDQKDKAIEFLKDALKKKSAVSQEISKAWKMEKEISKELLMSVFRGGLFRSSKIRMRLTGKEFKKEVPDKSDTISEMSSEKDSKSDQSDEDKNKQKEEVKAKV